MSETTSRQEHPPITLPFSFHPTGRFRRTPLTRFTRPCLEIGGETLVGACTYKSRMTGRYQDHSGYPRGYTTIYGTPCQGHSTEPAKCRWRKQVKHFSRHASGICAWGRLMRPTVLISAMLRKTCLASTSWAQSRMPQPSSGLRHCPDEQLEEALLLSPLASAQTMTQHSSSKPNLKLLCAIAPWQDLDGNPFQVYRPRQIQLHFCKDSDCTLLSTSPQDGFALFWIRCLAYFAPLACVHVPAGAELDTSRPEQPECDSVKTLQLLPSRW